MTTPNPKQAPQIVPFGQIPILSDAQLAEAARVTKDDVKDAKAWVQSFQRAALVINFATGKASRYLPASLYKRFWEARTR